MSNTFAIRTGLKHSPKIAKEFAPLLLTLIKRKRMTKDEIFVSFDFDNDKVLIDFTIRHTKFPDSPFEVMDRSLKEVVPKKDWKENTRSAIKILEIVICKLDASIYRATGLLKEVRMVGSRVQTNNKYK